MEIPHIDNRLSGSHVRRRCKEPHDISRGSSQLLFPAIREFGWNGGYGIASKEVAEDARLAYQLVKVLRREYVLPVTNEPIAQIIENPQLM